MKFPSRKSYYYFYLDMDECLRENFDDAVTYVYRRNPRDEDDLKSRMPELFSDDGRFPLCLLRDHEYRNSEAFEACLDEYYEQRNRPGHPSLSTLVDYFFWCDATVIKKLSIEGYQCRVYVVR